MSDESSNIMYVCIVVVVKRYLSLLRNCQRVTSLVAILYLLMNRSVSKVNDEWFADEERVRANVGLLEKPATSKRKNVKEVLLDTGCIIPLRRLAVLLAVLFLCILFLSPSYCLMFSKGLVLM